MVIGMLVCPVRLKKCERQFAGGNIKELESAKKRNLYAVCNLDRRTVLALKP